MHFTVSGRGLPEAAVARAIDLSHHKYCSATHMLGKTAEITTSYELSEAVTRCAGSDVVGGDRHHLGSAAHRQPDRPRQPLGASRFGAVRVAQFVLLHLLDDRARIEVLRRQAVEVSLQVPLDLALGLDDEAEALGIAGASRPAGRRRMRRRTRAD